MPPTAMLLTHDATTVVNQPWLGSDALVLEPLVIALVMSLNQVVANHRVERSLSDYQHLGERCVRDGTDTSFTRGVQMETPWEHDDGVHSHRLV